LNAGNILKNLSGFKDSVIAIKFYTQKAEQSITLAAKRQLVDAKSKTATAETVFNAYRNMLIAM